MRNRVSAVSPIVAVSFVDETAILGGGGCIQAWLGGMRVPGAREGSLVPRHRYGPTHANGVSEAERAAVGERRRTGRQRAPRQAWSALIGGGELRRCRPLWRAHGGGYSPVLDGGMACFSVASGGL